MSTLIVGDVHGCAEELAKVVALAGASRVVLVGDLFTKGPDPVGVWTQVRDGGFEAVLGNHDARLLDAISGSRPRDHHAHEVIAALDAEDAGWRAFLSATPLHRDVGGYLVVHAGVHPKKGLAGTRRGQLLAMRRHPEGRKDAPLWHARYAGNTPIVFGHDARRGLVWRTRAGRPHVVGLDTGCVYGGVLSAFEPESGGLIQVPARARYLAVG